MKHKLSYNRTKTQKCNKTWPPPPQIKFFILFFPTSSVDMHLKLIQTHFVLILFVVHAHLLLTNSFFLFKPLNRNTVNQERDQGTTKQKGKKNVNLLKPNSLSVHNSSLFFFSGFIQSIQRPNQRNSQNRKPSQPEQYQIINKIKMMQNLFNFATWTKFPETKRNLIRRERLKKDLSVKSLLFFSLLSLNGR